jgi:hypothetical protein
MYKKLLIIFIIFSTILTSAPGCNQTTTTSTVTQVSTPTTTSTLTYTTTSVTTYMTTVIPQTSTVTVTITSSTITYTTTSVTTSVTTVIPQTTTITVTITSTTTYTFPSSTVTLPSGTDLVFETISKNNGTSGPYESKNAQISIINVIQPSLPESLQWVYPQSQNGILAVDYSQYFIIMAFNGWRGGIGAYFNIIRIWQSDGIVFVLAHFDDPKPGGTSLPAVSSQYQVVKVSRTQIAQTGDITFKLFDETGQERATTVETINK